VWDGTVSEMAYLTEVYHVLTNKGWVKPWNVDFNCTLACLDRKQNQLFWEIPGMYMTHYTPNEPVNLLQIKEKQNQEIALPDFGPIYAWAPGKRGYHCYYGDEIYDKHFLLKQMTNADLSKAKGTHKNKAFKLSNNIELTFNTVGKTITRFNKEWHNNLYLLWVNVDAFYVHCHGTHFWISCGKEFEDDTYLNRIN